MSRIGYALMMYCGMWALWAAYIFANVIIYNDTPRVSEINWMWIPTYFGSERTADWFSTLWASAIYTTLIASVWGLIDPRGTGVLYRVLQFIPLLCTIFSLLNMFVFTCIYTVGVAIVFIGNLLALIGKIFDWAHS